MATQKAASPERVGKEDIGSPQTAVGWELHRYGGRLLKLLKAKERRLKMRGRYRADLRAANSDVPTRRRREQARTSARVRRLVPLVLATMASQALMVVLAPTMVEVGHEFGTSVGAVGQARSVLAGAAIVTSLGLAPFLDRLGLRPLLSWGALLALAGSAGAALAPSLAVFISVHALVGIGFACLLSAGFAGVAAFEGKDRAWAMGYVVGANALAWIVVNPLAGALTESLSWRAAHVTPAAIALCVLATVRAAPEGHASATSGVGLRGVLGDRSARRWVLAETISFFSWGTYLTFIGAYLIERHHVGESAVGVVLALGAGAFFLTSVRGARLLARLPGPRLIAAVTLVMGALIPLQFNTDGFVLVGILTFILCAAAGGLRSALSSTLGLSQLPQGPGSMMAARTAAIQMGYLLGGLIGGVTLALGGYVALGIVLGTALVLGATLVLRVTDPLTREETRNARP